jgi:hypothetical protein
MRIALLLLVGGCLCGTALAWPPEPVPIGDVAFNYWGGGNDRGSTVVYSNLEQSTDPNEFYLPQTETGVPYGDDLHLTAAGWMDAFTFAYYDPEGGTALSQVDVLFYENDPENSDFPGGDPGSLLLGSYTVMDLPGDGAHVFSVDVSANPLLLPEDIWIEFDFSNSPEAGLVLYDPPTVGSSDDLFEVHGVDVFVFSYPHIANFGLEITTGEEQPRCYGDLDGDNDRDLADLAEMLGHYGETTGVFYENGDLDEDGDVDLADLAGLLGVYGEACP